MPIYITQAQYSAATKVNKDTVSRRFRDLPYATGASTNTNARQYHLAAALTTVKRSDLASLPALFAAATQESGPYFVGEGVLPLCHRLIEWMDAAARARRYRLQVTFTEALVRGLQTSNIFEHIDALRLKLVLHPGVLRFVVLNEPTELPDFKGGFPIQFAITNARYEPIFTEMETV